MLGCQVSISRRTNLILENLFCAGTYRKILDLIAKPARERAEIKLQCVVKRVETTSDTVRLCTENGEELEFDEVVMTTPLGWLKNNKGAFHPSLPTRFSEAIDAIGYSSK
jgi:monoamine oxidase